MQQEKELLKRVSIHLLIVLPRMNGNGFWISPETIGQRILNGQGLN